MDILQRVFYILISLDKKQVNFYLLDNHNIEIKTIMSYEKILYGIVAHLDRAQNF